MCGIAGLLAPDLPAPERLEHVRAMVARLRHRGPSGEALWDGGECALGLTRLAIVAPRQTARALESETGDVVGVANGEIYNHRELDRELRGRGHTLADGPDTALLPHLYEERGDGFPEALDGMFAAALWDRTTHTLTLARDRAGEKPLFYAAAPGRFAFASEPGALALLPWLSRDPAPAPLARYLVHGAFAGEDCAFAAIRQLPPAHTLAVRAGGERLRRYWRPWDALVARREPPPTAAEAPARTGEALARAVASRLPAEVPFGVFLSGGVDSGLVAVLAARAWGRPFPTFSMRVDHRGYDESPFARRVAKSIHAEHHELEMGAREGEEAFARWAAGMDQPLGDPSVLPTWLLARHASYFVPVVLTGEGGDELFAGYPTYLGHRHARLAGALPAPLAGAVAAIARRLRPRHHHVTLAHLLERFLGVRGLPPFERHLAWFGTARAGEALALLAPELRAAAGEQAPLQHARHLERALTDMELLPRAGAPPLVAYQLLDFETYLGGGLLTKVDRCTMAHGVESRAPFLRAALVDFALGLPEEARLRGATGKWALKQAARALLPADLLARRKQGFSPPFSAWARGPLRGLVVDALSPARVARAGVLDVKAVQRLLRAHLDGREDRGRTLWALLSLQSWAERWVLAAPRREPAPPAREFAVARP
ncbi:MAG TPA: asparagine synthase (glutamine-hydrolyzing) [Candidatus Eisenbacteria bacterium]|nr:asparagine synthase (glutamine-hydrolyzing) [Candidatus Eisenbacteria bacterium]